MLPPSPSRRGTTEFWIFVQVAFLLAAGCSPERYRESADRQVSEILVHKQAQVIPRDEALALARFPIAIEEAGVVGEDEDFRRAPAPSPVVEPVALEDDSNVPKASGAPPTAAPAAAPGEQAPAKDGAVPPPAAGAPESQAGPATPSEEPAAAPAPPPEPETAAPPPAQPEATAPPAEPGAAAPPPSTPASGSQAAPPAGPAPPAGDGAATRATTGAPTVPVRVLTLEEALRIAFANNRDYQTEKESVYLSALALTLARWQFAPRFFGLLSGDIETDGAGTTSGSVASDFGWNQLLASGARFTLSVANNFFQFFTGDRQEVARTLLSATITQPLLRGFGRDIVLEPLGQAERDVIYSIRGLERFRQEFVVGVATEFYRVLEARTLITNEYANWQSLVNNLDRARNLALGERLPKFEVDQVEQQELQARNRYVFAVEDYENLLDRFKVTLDLPIEARIALDERELDRLSASAVVPITHDVEDAVNAALVLRLDLLTARDRSADAERRVRVAADALRAQLDLSLTAELPSGTAGAEQPFKFDTKDGIYGARLDLDLPFDRRAERNDYAASLIDAERQARDAKLFEDNVRVTVRDAHRRLERNRQTLSIQEASRALAEARVASTLALRDAGRAETRDVLESQEALIGAKNAYTAALISLAVTRLQFHSETGTLRIEPDGRFSEAPMEEAKNVRS